MPNPMTMKKNYKNTDAEPDDYEENFQKNTDAEPTHNERVEKLGRT